MIKKIRTSPLCYSEEEKFSFLLFLMLVVVGFQFPKTTGDIIWTVAILEIGAFYLWDFYTKDRLASLLMGHSFFILAIAALFLSAGVTYTTWALIWTVFLLIYIGSLLLEQAILMLKK